MDADILETCIAQTTLTTRVTASCRPFHVLSTSSTLIFADQHRREKVLQHVVRLSQATVQAMQPAGLELNDSQHTDGRLFTVLMMSLLPKDNAINVESCENRTS
jgi:hypothetical protein